MKDFEVVLQGFFGERAREFSESLRASLKQVWYEGIKHGIYLEREQQPIPEGLLAGVAGLPAPAEDLPRPATGTAADLEEVVEKLVDKAETLSIKIENNLDVTPAMLLEGVERMKARHRFLSQAEKLNRDLNEMIRFVDGFKVHSY